MISLKSSAKEWYEERGPGQLASLSGVIASVKQENVSRAKDLLSYLRLYDSSLVLTMGRSSSDAILGGARVGAFATHPGSVREGCAINIVRRITDYAVNKLGKSSPGVKILTTGDDHSAHLKAKELQALCEGCFRAGDADKHAIVALTHGCLFGTGLVKVVEDVDRVTYEWTWPGEVLVAADEQAYGQPRNLYQLKMMDRDVLIRRFPASKAVLSKLACQVEVWEAWHLPSGPGEGDGRHCILVPGHEILDDEEYEYSRFPFAIFQYATPPVGFWAIGLGKMLVNYQFDINNTLRNIQRNIQAGGSLKVLVDRGSAVAPATINNDLRGTIIEYSGQAPTWLATPSVSGDVVNHLNLMISQAWEETGWSQANSTAEKPAGIGSGIALRTWLDSITERQVVVGKQWDGFYRQLAQLTIDAAERIYKRNKNFEISYRHGKSAIQKASMERAMMEVGDYEIEIMSAARFPDTPSGRLEYVEELVAKGMIDQSAALELLDIPDVESELKNRRAAIELIDQQIELMLKDIDVPAPSEWLDLNLAKQRVSMAITRAMLHAAPGTVQERLINWSDQVQGMLDAAAAPLPGAEELPPEEMPVDEEQMMAPTEELPPEEIVE